MLLVTSTHPQECQNAHGDRILLQTLKNKVDYCRLHGVELFHNTDVLDEAMSGWWAKVLAMRMLLLARPDVEWLLWMDSDAVFTNMTFDMPLERYKDHNMVMHGRQRKVYGHKSWLGLNTGPLAQSPPLSLSLSIVVAKQTNLQVELDRVLSKLITHHITQQGKPPERFRDFENLNAL